MSSNLSFKRAQPCMGTTLEIQIQFGELEGSRDEMQEALSEKIQLLISDAFQKAHALADALSFFNSDSLLTHHNQSTVASAFANEAKVFASTLQSAKKLASRFPRGFLLNADGKAAVDLSGIAKGAVVDEVYEWLQAELRRCVGSLAASCDWSVNAGGDLRVSGVSEVEIRVPSSSAEEKRYNLQMLGSAVATSSHQALNVAVGTAAGKYADEFKKTSRAASVSVIARTCRMSDAFTKIAFQYDLANILSPNEAHEYGLLAILNFDSSGELLSAHEWNV